MKGQIKHNFTEFKLCACPCLMHNALSLCPKICTDNFYKGNT